MKIRRTNSRQRIWLPTLWGLILLASCGGGGANGPVAADGGEGGRREGVRPWTPEDAGTEARPPYGELQDFLMSELERLGKDPSRTTSEVAKGDSDRVFDLRPALIDPDGPGGDPPTGVSLNWTEVLTGDYDQNGLVTIAEITALGQNLGKAVTYDVAALHGSFAYWPEGDPNDDGGETPPTVGSPAANWRLARIDGDRNGLLTISDTTPIAQHWQEALSGYRIYRQAPGESQFTMLPGLPGTNDFLSIEHPSAPGNAPVRYSFADDSATTSGVYLYYVAPYDLQSQAQGPASGIVSIDLDTGTVNSSPVANLSVTPDFAGAPAVITLDATASYDPDGSIAAYEWDFDGDGTTDWLSIDPLPEASSDGTVDSFEEVSPGKIRATYRQGSAEYLVPSVEVMDNAGAIDDAVAQLGLSGWIHEVISADDEAFDPPGTEITFIVQDMEIDPGSGEVVICGVPSSGYLGGSQVSPSAFFGRRDSLGNWSEELVMPFTGTILEELQARPLNMEIGWQANGEPLILFTAFADYSLLGYDKRIILCKRVSSENWVKDVVFEGELPLTTSRRGPSNGYVVQTENGKFSALISDTTEGSTGEGFAAQKYYVLNYEHGVISIEYTGWNLKDMDPARYGLSLAISPSNEKIILLSPDYPAHRLEVGGLVSSSEGSWELISLFTSKIDLTAIGPIAYIYDQHDNGWLVFGSRPDISNLYDGIYWIVNPNENNPPVQLQRGTQTNGEVYSGSRGISFFSFVNLLNTDFNRNSSFHDLYELNDKVIHEEIYGIDVPENSDGFTVLHRDAVSVNNGNLYAILNVYGGDEFSVLTEKGVDRVDVQLFCTRVDPRPVP